MLEQEELELGVGQTWLRVGTLALLLLAVKPQAGYVAVLSSEITVNVDKMSCT